MESTGTNSQVNKGSTIQRWLILAVAAILTWGALLLPVFLKQTNLGLVVGSVASQDILAPHDLTYVSGTLSAQAREDAVSNVQPVYLPADPSISRAQLEKLQSAGIYVTAIRADSYASFEQKIRDISSIPEFSLSEQLINSLLNLSDTQWELVRRESESVLEQSMRGTVREDQLTVTKRAIPSMVNFSLPVDMSILVTEIVSPYIVPNSLFSEELTEAQRKDASAGVAPVSKRYMAGEILARKGQVITPTILEALNAYDLVTPTNYMREYISAGSLVLLSVIMVIIYFAKRKPLLRNQIRSIAVIATLFLVFLISSRAIVSGHTIYPYLFPIAAYGMIIACVFNFEIAALLSVILSALSAFNQPNAPDLFVYYLLSSLVGILVLGRGMRVLQFFTAGLAAGIAGIAVIIAYRLVGYYTDIVGIIMLLGAAMVYGLASASLTLVFQFLLAQLLGITTALQLMDVLRPDHPLLQQMLRTMPGSYQHSLQVSNLAEQAADAIGADSLLTRAGAIFHDAGKSQNPLFFIENQVNTAVNPHDGADPVETARTIIQHVYDGVALAKKYKLPTRVIDFIREHHGTMLTRYQYGQALKLAGDDPSLVNIEDFRYPGPPPQSKETALLMMSDGLEARARSEVPKSEDEIRILAKKVVEFCRQEGQLDQTNLTFQDLNNVIESFTKTLINLYHPRIKYPEPVTTPLQKTEKTENTTPLPRDSSRSGVSTS